MHKSEVIKKTLSPVWNEHFDFSVPSRVASKFFVRRLPLFFLEFSTDAISQVTVYDWDRVGADTPLGRGRIDLSTVEAFEQTEVTVPLSDAKTGIAKGSIRVKITFKPGYFARARGATSTFSSLGGAFGGGALGVASVGFNGVGAVAGGVGSIGKGVGKGLGGIGKGVGGLLGGRRSSASPSSLQKSTSASDLPPIPAVPAYLLAESPATSLSPSGKTSPPLSQAGVLAVTIEQLVGAEEIDEKHCISLRAYGKDVHTTHSQKAEGGVFNFNEVFTIKTIPGACELDFSIM